MNEHRAICDPRQIELFLHQQLTDEEQLTFERHLDDCESCRQQLESVAAAAHLWSGVQEALQGEPLPAEEQSSTDSTLDALAGGPAAFSLKSILSMLAPTDDDRMLGRLGTYEVVGVIGTGGMGVVVKALDATLNRYVAIKVLAPHLGSSGAARKRFLREAQAAAAVVHDNVIEIHTVAEANGLPYLVMPYLPGPSLERRLDRDGPLALVEILRIGMQAAAGLAAAHAQGLVHRDVKPANILLADGVERVKLTDFGLARAADDASLTLTGIIAGTPQFMSPEQARGESVDQRSDLFSLGSVLYAMCTGRAPFRAETSYGVLRKVIDEEPRSIRELNPEIPQWLCHVIARLMSKQPEGRYASAGEVARLLEECLAHVQQPTAVPLPASLEPPKKRPSLSASRKLQGAIAMITGATLILLAFVLNLPSDSTPVGQGNDAATKESEATSSGSTTQEDAVRQDDAGESTQPDTTPAAAAGPQVTLLHRFADVTGGNDAVIAVSPDGKLIALANRNPTLTMIRSGVSRVSGDWKPTALVLDAATGETVATLELIAPEEQEILTATEHISHVEAAAIAWSPDGRQIAVGTNIGQVKLFTAKTGQLVRSFDDTAAKQADPKTPDNWKSISRAMGSVAALAFSPDGSLLAMCGGSFADFAERFDGVQRLGFRATGPGRLKLWDVAAGTLKYDLVGHNDHANAVAFSPDGNWLASAGRWLKDRDFGNGVILWNPHTGQQIHSLIRSTANGGVRSIAFSPDSQLLVLGTQRFDDDSSSGGVSLVRVSSGIEQWLVTVPGWATPVAFRPDGKEIAVLCGGKSIRFLATDSGTTAYLIRPEDPVREVRWDSFAMATHGGLLAISAVDLEREDNAQRRISVDVWGAIAGGDIGPPATESPDSSPASDTSNRVRHFSTDMKIGVIACSPRGKQIAIANQGPTLTVDDDNTVSVVNDWKPRVQIVDNLTGKMIHSLHLTSDEEDAAIAAAPDVPYFLVTALEFSPDGNQLAIGTSIGQVKLFDARTGHLTSSLNDAAERATAQHNEHGLNSLPRAMGGITALNYSPDGSLLAMCGDSFADFTAYLNGFPRICDSAASPGRLKTWDAKTGALQHDLVGHSQALDVAFSPDGRLLASAGRSLFGGVARSETILWEVPAGNKFRTIATQTAGQFYATAFLPDGKRIASSTFQIDPEKAADSGTCDVYVAQVDSGVVQWQRKIDDAVVVIPFFSEGAYAIALGGPQSIRYLDSRTGDTLARIKARFADQPEGWRWNDFAVAQQGRMLVIGADGETGGTVEVWDLTPPDTVDRSQQQTPGK